MTRRILISVLLAALVAVFPYWVYLPAIALAIILLPFYLEGLVLALIVDTLYGAGTYWMSLSAAILLILTPHVRKRLRFHA